MISPTSPLNTPVPLLVVPCFSPHDVVVVSHLHHAVALAENGFQALFQLAFTRIECLLQTAVERNGSAAVPLGGESNLYLCSSKAVVLWAVSWAQSCATVSITDAGSARFMKKKSPSAPDGVGI